jgi:hypothetical protein
MKRLQKMLAFFATMILMIAMNMPAQAQCSTRPPSYYYEKGSSTILFCVRLDGDEGRHLPALINSNDRTDAKANGMVNGFNWEVKPSADFIGDHGCTCDGTFYISEDLVKQYGSYPYLVEVKATATSTSTASWPPVKMYYADGYYLCRPVK